MDVPFKNTTEIWPAMAIHGDPWRLGQLFDVRISIDEPVALDHRQRDGLLNSSIRSLDFFLMRFIYLSIVTIVANIIASRKWSKIKRINWVDVSCPHHNWQVCLYLTSIAFSFGTECPIWLSVPPIYWFKGILKQERPIFPGKIYGLRLGFSLKPIHRTLVSWLNSP